MTVYGFGAQPMGASPYGVGTPAVSTDTNAGKTLTSASGTVYGGRYINPQTGLYEFDSNGRYVGTTDVKQLVVLAVKTARGSSAVQTLGFAPPVGVIGNNFVAKMKEAVNQAFAQLVRAGLVAIVDIDVRKNQRPVVTIVRWRDLTTDAEHTEQI